MNGNLNKIAEKIFHNVRCRCSHHRHVSFLEPAWDLKDLIQGNETPNLLDVST